MLAIDCTSKNEGEQTQKLTDSSVGSGVTNRRGGEVTWKEESPLHLWRVFPLLSRSQWEEADRVVSVETGNALPRSPPPSLLFPSVRSAGPHNIRQVLDDWTTLPDYEYFWTQQLEEAEVKLPQMLGWPQHTHMKGHCAHRSREPRAFDSVMVFE